MSFRQTSHCKFFNLVVTRSSSSSLDGHVPARLGLGEDQTTQHLCIKIYRRR
ncbi:hypothetical protein WN55_04102 [Dufourea novaeangliae]|uniref:Uncharacterized protein n=1 Tax=Dufourea novaeangliae TaxID=178035 RepID=A0A154PLA2_DUFNO|nr:hypothetical protein WN55_04102 [Dufourea novaeangliae]